MRYLNWAFFLILTAMFSTSFAAPRALINGSFDNSGKTSSDLQIGESGRVFGGTLCGRIENAGEIADVTLCETGQIQGGQLAGIINNQGVIGDINLKADAVVKGGRLAGKIIGDATYPAYLGALTLATGSSVCGVKLSPTVILEPQVTLCDTVIMPKDPQHPTLMDFNLDPNTLGQLNTQQLQHSEEIAFSLLSAEQIRQLPSSVFAELNAAHLRAISWSGMWGISYQQFSQLSLELLEAFHQGNLGALPSEVINQLNLKQLMALQPVVKTLSEREIIKFLTNLSRDIPISTVLDFVPYNWQVDETTGDLTPPPHAQLAFRKINNQADVPQQVDLEYELPDLNTGLGIAGRTAKTTVLEELQQAITLSGLSQMQLSQQSDGILNVTQPELQLSLIPDVFNMRRAAEGSQTGVFINASGNYRIVTPRLFEISFISIPKKFKELPAVFGEQSYAKCNKQGDVLLQVGSQYLRRGRDGEEVSVVGIFDPFVEPAPEEFCHDGVCDWTLAADSMQPGLVLPEEPRAQRTPKITYNDGTSQKFYPTVLQPEYLMTEAEKIAGVEAIQFNTNGTFSVQYRGAQFQLSPSFYQMQKTAVQSGQQFAPQLTINADNTVSYQVQDGEQLFTFQLAITAPNTQ